MRRILLALTATAIVVAASYAVKPTTATAPTTAFAATDSRDSALTIDVPAPEPRDVGPQPSSAAATELDRLIGLFEDRTVAGTSSSLNFATLGKHYSTRAALTGNIADYESAATAYAKAYTMTPGNRQSQIGYATAAAAIHNFATALEVATVALEADPTDADALAIAADAWLELGDIAIASSILEELDTALPNHPAIIARLANLAHLEGRQSEAIALATEAHSEAKRRGVRGKKLAFFPLLEADLLLDAGRYEEALEAVEEAIAVAARYPVAYASLGRVQSHLGDFASALNSYEKAVSMQSDPGWRISLGELLIALGRDDEAVPYLGAAQLELEASNETIFGQSLAQFYADRNIEPEAALRLARQNVAARPSIDAYDTLAWALYRTGDFTAASDARDHAIATGAQDAGLLYHSALISAATGDTERAAAELRELLERNPGFHPLQSRQAQQLLDSISG